MKAVKALLKEIIGYFKYASTWKGLVGLVTAAGLTLQPELQEAIIAAGMAIVGLIQVFVDDRAGPKA